MALLKVQHKQVGSILQVYGILEPSAPFQKCIYELKVKVHGKFQTLKKCSNKIEDKNDVVKEHLDKSTKFINCCLNFKIREYNSR